MARPSTFLVIFLVAFNLMGGIMMSQGIAPMLGLDSTVGENSEVDSAINETREVNTGTSLGDTLFGMYNTLARGVGAIFQFIFPGLNMLRRAGVPLYLTNTLGTLFSFVIAFDVMSYIRGWGL